MTFVQYTAPPGLVAVSYSNYCNDSLCNNKKSLDSIWEVPDTTGTWNMGMSTKVSGCLLYVSAQFGPQWAKHKRVPQSARSFSELLLLQSKPLLDSRSQFVTL